LIDMETSTTKDVTWNAEAAAAQPRSGMRIEAAQRRD